MKDDRTPPLRQVIAPSLTLDIVRAEILDNLLHLANDPIPNIRFNVAKALEVFATTFGDSAEGRQIIQQKVIPVLEALKNDSDQDVRFFALRALQKAHEVGGRCPDVSVPAVSDISNYSLRAYVKVRR